jgi:hypothetical protein
MSQHNHSHEHHDCGHERNGNEHEHDDNADSGPQNSLFRYIDRPNVVALNAGDSRGPEVIKPWHERNDNNVVRRHTAQWKHLIS